MKAPSEKHLQQYIFDHPEILGVIETPHENINEYEFIKKEAKLPSGIADFLSVCHCDYPPHFVVIETKKDSLNSKALAQILRYMRDIQGIWKYAIAGLPTPNAGIITHYEIPKVKGLLIGASADDDLIISAQAAHVSVAVYSFDGTDYEFNWLFSKDEQVSHLDYAYGAIGEAIRELYMELLNLEQQPESVAKMYKLPSIEFYHQMIERSLNRDNQ